MSQAPSRPTLAKQLQGCLIRDRFSLSKLAGNPRQAKQFEKRKARSEASVRTRLAAKPAVQYPDILPVVGRLEDLKAAISKHQVVIVAGETGSGKTTQLPKICLELGRGILGTIGHTQPRRVAARTVAARLAEELAVPIGEQVGFQIRFGDQTSDRGDAERSISRTIRHANYR
jgi:ATP-dependent helicase HrpA